MITLLLISLNAHILLRITWLLTGLSWILRIVNGLIIHSYVRSMKKCQKVRERKMFETFFRENAQSDTCGSQMNGYVWVIHWKKENPNDPQISRWACSHRYQNNEHPLAFWHSFIEQTFKQMINPPKIRRILIKPVKSHVMLF